MLTAQEPTVKKIWYLNILPIFKHCEFKLKREIKKINIILFLQISNGNDDGGVKSLSSFDQTITIGSTNNIIYKIDYTFSAKKEDPQIEAVDESLAVLTEVGSFIQDVLKYYEPIAWLITINTQ